MEAVSPTEIFWIFSGKIQKISGWNTASTPSAFRPFPAGTGDIPASSVRKPAGSGDRNRRLGNIYLLY